MKTTKFTCLVLALALITSSCNSSYQAAGGVTGAMIGSNVGSAIGSLSGHGHGRHFRGRNAALGSLIGMGIGAALGVGISSQIEKKEKAEASRYEDYDYAGGQINQRTSNTDNTPYQTSGGVNQDRQNAVVSISDISYMDMDGNAYISKGETIEIEGYITNTSNSVLKDIIIFLTTDDKKRFRISPALTTTLQPGQKIRYTGRLVCDRAKQGQSVGVNLNTLYNGMTTTSNTLYVQTR